MSGLGNTSNAQVTACRLYNEFAQGVYVGEYPLCLLATNLRFLQGGKEWYLYQLERTAPPKVVGKMTGYMNFIEKQNYRPTNCFKCKYYAECEAKNLTKGTMVHTLNPSAVV